MVTFTGIVHPKMKFLSLFTRLHVLQNPFYFFQWNKKRIFKEYSHTLLCKSLRLLVFSPTKMVLSQLFLSFVV